jgi:hypothetical protein
MTYSAARTFTNAGLVWSSMTLSSVVAAVASCWSFAKAWEPAGFQSNAPSGYGCLGETRSRLLGKPGEKLVQAQVVNAS